MAVVGDAYIVVRALTDRVRDDIRDGFKGADREGERAGRDSGDGFARGWGRSGGNRGGMFQNLQRNADAAREKFNNLIQVGYALGPALVALTSTLGGVAGGLFAMGAQAAAAGPALLSLINVFSAVAQAGFTLMAVFKGVGSAISAGLNAGGGGGGGGGADLARQIEDANRRIEDAQKRLAQVIQQNNERIVQANKEIVRAERNKRDAMYESEQANFAVTESEEDYEQALRDTSEARKQAAEDIQQLNFALESSVLSEERAVLAYEKAQEEYLKAQNLPPNNRARREAELAFKEADLRLRQAKDKTNDTQAEVDEANSKGVEGSDRVVSALEREKDAAKGVDDAKRSAYLASRDLADAIEAEEDAINNLNAVIAENVSRLAEAERAVEDARRALDDIGDSAGAAGGGVDKFAEAMAKLSPKAQEFVRIILGIVKAFKPIKLLAQEAFFENFNDAVQELADVYLPVLEEKLPKTAGLLGEIGANILGVVSSTENVGRVERIWDSNDIIIRNLGEAVVSLVDSFLILLDNLRPLAEEFSEWIATITDGWNETLIAKDKTGELADTFAYSAKVVKTLGRIFGNLFRAIGNIGKAAAGPGSGGETLLNLFEGVTEKWAEFTGSLEGQNKLEKFFTDIVPVVSEFGGLISDIFGAIFKITGETTEETASFIGSLRTVVGTFENIGTSISGALPIIGEFLEKASEAIENLTSSGAIEAFFGVLRDAAGVIAGITGSAIFQQIFGVVAPIFAVSRGLSLVLKFLKFIFLGAIIGNITKFGAVFKGLGTIFRLISKPAASLRLLFMKFPITMGLLKLAISPIGLIIMGVVAALIAMWRESEIFREAVKELVDKVLNRAVELFNELKEKVEAALEPLGGMEGTIDKLKTVFKFLGDIVGTYVIPLLEYGLMNAFAVVGAVIGTIIDTVGGLIKTFKNFFDKLGKGDIAGAMKELFYGIFIRPIKTVLDNFLGLIKNVMGNVVDFVKNIFGDSFVTDIVSGLVGVIQGILGIFEDAWNAVLDWVKGFLGISSPSTLFQEIGQAVVDGVAAALTFLLDIFLLPFKGAWAAVKFFVDDVVLGFWRALPDRLKSILRTLYGPIFDFLKDAWTNAKKYVDNTLIPFIKGLPAKFLELLGNLWKPLSTLLDTAITAVKNLFPNFINAITGPDGLVSKMKSALSKLWEPLTSGLSAAWAAAKAWWNANVAGKGFTLGGFLGIPKVDIRIPSLAEGGVISPRSGGTLAIIGEAGRSERVEPLDENGLSNRDKAMISFLSGGAGGGTTINVYPSEGMNERELAQKVSRELALQIRRGAI